MQALLKGGYQVCLLHPAQMHVFAQQRGLRAKTDQLDAVTIARALLSGEARFGYVPSEQVATYRELMRLQKQLVLPLEMVDNFRSLCKSPLADFFVSGKS